MSPTPPLGTSFSSEAQESWKNSKCSKRWSAAKKSTVKSKFLKEYEAREREEEKQNSYLWQCAKIPIGQLFTKEALESLRLEETAESPVKKNWGSYKASEITTVFSVVEERRLDCPGDGADGGFKLEEEKGVEVLLPEHETFVLDRRGKPLRGCLDVREEKSRFLSLFITKNTEDDDNKNDGDAVRKEYRGDGWSKANRHMMDSLLMKRTVQ